MLNVECCECCSSQNPSLNTKKGLTTDVEHIHKNSFFISLVFTSSFFFYIHWIFFNIIFKITLISFFIQLYFTFILLFVLVFDGFLKLHFDLSSTWSNTVLDSTFNFISLMCTLYSPFVFSSYCFGTGFLCFLHWC